MPKTEIDLPTRLYALAVVAGGVSSGAAVLASGSLAGTDVAAVGVLGTLCFLSTAFSPSYQGYFPSRVVFQTSSAFLFALLLLVPPAAACLVLWAYAGTDWIVHRRRFIMGGFNLGQLSLALGAATLVLRALPGEPVMWTPTRPLDLALGLLAVGVFSLVNQALTFGVLSLAGRRAVFRRNPITRSGLLTETLCITSGVAMAALWSLWPPLVVLALLPLWILPTLLALLGRREQDLEAHRDELRSLQQLGLELGGQLDEAHLHASIVRVATETFHAAGACLVLVPPEDGAPPAIAAHAGVCAHGSLVASHLLQRACEASDVTLEEPATPATRTALALPAGAGLLFVPLRMSDGRRGCLVVIRDVHRRRFDEADARRARTLAPFLETALANARLVAALRDMQAQLVHTERMSALGLLVSGVAHELNNPLTSVQGYAELWAAREDDPRRRAALELIAREAERAGTIVRHLLTFARPGSGRTDAVDVAAVVRRVVALREHDLQLKEVELELQLEEPLPAVSAETTALQQVLLNLLANAEHAVAQRPRPRRIRIGARAAGTRVVLSVADNGPGVPENIRDRIFLPFFTTKPVGQGTGLGLAISRRLVESYGGTLRLDPAVEGACFVVDLPQAATEPKRPPAAAGPAAFAPAPALGPHCLLVVDDEPAICGLVRDALEPRGWRVEQARDGLEALEKVRANHDYDVLLVDVRMPRMNGPEFYEKLQEERPELARRVIFSSGHLEADLAGLSVGPTHWLAKPYDLRTLVERVSAVAALDRRPR